MCVQLSNNKSYYGIMATLSHTASANMIFMCMHVVHRYIISRGGWEGGCPPKIICIYLYEQYCLKLAPQMESSLSPPYSGSFNFMAS